jgi:hypothetical protein
LVGKLYFQLDVITPKAVIFRKKLFFTQILLHIKGELAIQRCSYQETASIMSAILLSLKMLSLIISGQGGTSGIVSPHELKISLHFCRAFTLSSPLRKVLIGQHLLI